MQVWLLAVGKPIQIEARVSIRESLLYSRGQRPEDRGLLSKDQLPTADEWARAFKGEFPGCTGRGRGLRAEQQSVLTVILKLVTWWSD